MLAGHEYFKDSYQPCYRKERRFPKPSAQVDRESNGVLTMCMLSMGVLMRRKKR